MTIKILVVDDEPSIRKGMKLGLSSKEIEIDSVETGAEGLVLGSQKSYDVIIADLCLPDIDGLDLVKKVRSHFPEIVSIIITGNPMGKKLIKTITDASCTYLEKPLDIKTVKKAINQGLKNQGALIGKGLVKKQMKKAKHRA